MVIPFAPSENTTPRAPSHPHYPTASQATNATFGSGSLFGYWLGSLFYGIDYHNYCNTFAWLDFAGRNRTGPPTTLRGFWASVICIFFFLPRLFLLPYLCALRWRWRYGRLRYGKMAQGNRCDEGYISTYIYVCIYRVDLCAGEVFSLPTVATAPTGGKKILSKRAQKLASVRKNVVRMKMMIPNMMGPMWRPDPSQQWHTRQ